MAAVGGSAGRDELMGFTVKELVTTLREEEKAASGAAARGKSVTKPHNLPHRETRSLFDRTKVLSSAVRPAGGHPHSRMDDDGSMEVNAFRPGLATMRPDPGRFLLRGGGTGGMATTALKARALKADSVPLKPPPKAGAMKIRPNPPNTSLRFYYERGDLPCKISQKGVKNKLAWKQPIDTLDFNFWLPVFMDGVREEEEPYQFIAMDGVTQLLDNGGSKILPTLPVLIMPIKQALNTRRPIVVCRMMKVLQRLVTADAHTKRPTIGRALVPYYRQILPVFNLLALKNKNLGDGIDYAQRKGENPGDLVSQTLELFEEFGGEEALVNIRYLVPCYPI